MEDKVQKIKTAIENGTYDWNGAIETTAEKLVLLNELNMW